MGWILLFWPRPWSGHRAAQVLGCITGSCPLRQNIMKPHSDQAGCPPEAAVSRCPAERGQPGPGQQPEIQERREEVGLGEWPHDGAWFCSSD